LVFREPFPLWLIFISHILANRILSSHLVMTFTVRHGKIHLLSSVNHLFLSIHPFLVGKPSISMGHLYHGYLTNNQRVNHEHGYSNNYNLAGYLSHSIL
jgi:hypothetical protein